MSFINSTQISKVSSYYTTFFFFNGALAESVRFTSISDLQSSVSKVQQRLQLERIESVLVITTNHTPKIYDKKRGNLTWRKS